MPVENRESGRRIAHSGYSDHMSNPTLDNYHAEPTPTDPAHLARVEDSRAPGGLVLVGTVHGHPRHADGELVMTAPVAWHEAEGRTVPTESGTVYELLTPDPKWVAWMEGQGIPFDAEDPVRGVGGVVAANPNPPNENPTHA